MSFETLESARDEATLMAGVLRLWEARKEGWEEDGGRGGLQARQAG